MLIEDQAYIRRAVSSGAYKNTRANALTARMRAEILRGDLKPGQKINLDKLRNAYGVSLSPLREAICRLAVDGLVHVQDQRGANIPELTAEELDEVGRVRREIDAIALRESILRGDATWAAQVRQTALALHGVASEPDAPELQECWAIAYTSFFHALISGCQMPMFISVCENYLDLQQRYHRQLPCGPEMLPTVWRSLAKVASLAIERDVDGATAALQGYQDRCVAALAERLSNRP